MNAEKSIETSPNSTVEGLETTHLFDEKEPDDNCVMLLNKHHNHHTHSRHHDHQTHDKGSVPAKKRSDYGAIRDASNVDPDVLGPYGKSSAVYVEEIRITGNRSVGDNENMACLSWPLSAKVTLFGLILAGALTLFDIQGLLQTLKVFRAASTGVLLYVAFFLVMPKSSAGCKSCQEEERV